MNIFLMELMNGKCLSHYRMSGYLKARMENATLLKNLILRCSQNMKKTILRYKANKNQSSMSMGMSSFMKI